jgi:predicted transcriptional regulator
MTTLTIRLGAKLEKALDRIAKSTGRTKSEIAREALKRQVAVARFRELRKKTLPFAEAQGLVTDKATPARSRHPARRSGAGGRASERG